MIRLFQVVTVASVVAYSFTASAEAPVNAPTQISAQQTSAWELDVGVGIAVPTQEFAEDFFGAGKVEGEIGPAVEVKAMYEVAPRLSLGGALRYRMHEAKVAELGFNIGTAHIATLAANIEYVLTEGPLGIYVRGSLGYNINSFDTSSEFDFACRSEFDGTCAIEPENGLAIVAGLGARYPLSDAILFTSELAWTSNSGEAELSVSNDDDTLKGDFDVSGLTFSLGLAFQL